MLFERSFQRQSTRAYDRDKALFIGPYHVEIDELPREGLIFPHNVDFYFDHLANMGLAGVFQEGNQEPLREDPSDPSKQTGTRIRSRYRLTDFGKRFVAAVTGQRK